ncbi:SDR family oxidoreductase [Oceaniserpentilla sp. 4NH20-0058]|uniref:SDR family oxidoreductase n=1 Tax=Oceaniserpentilla sp. 4NH20-0058 TaxID=3127660 RepID=UPI003103C557
MSHTVLITGANRGIGLSLAKQYVEQEWEVIAVCRESSDEIEDLADLVISGIDLSQDDAMDSVLQVLELAQGPEFTLDLLINNAGLFKNESLDSMSFDQIRDQFEVNTLAPLKVTHALIPLFKEGSKVINITSRMGSIEDNTSGAYYGYRASKAALNAFTKSLAVDLKPKGVAVAVVHPGFVQTRMVGFNGDLTPDESAAGIIKRAEELNIENSGGFWHSNGQSLPW